MEAAWFTPEQGREMWQDYLRRKQLPAQQTQNFPQRRLIDEPSPHRVFVCNTTEEVIPPYACMRVIGTRNINNITAIDVEKPTSTDGEFLFNSQYPIAAKIPAVVDPPTAAVYSVGWAYRFGIVVMLGDDPTTANKPYRPIIDSWEVEEGDGPFVVFGHHRAKEADDDRALIGRFVGGSDLMPGIVTAKRTCNPGYYTVQLAEWSGSYNNETDPEECPTYTVTGDGTAECAITLNEPSLQVTGIVDGDSNPVTVLAYDCQTTVVPLKLNKMVLLKNLGHTVVVGTGESAVTTPVWQIVRGRQVEAIYYEDTYDCCDGEGESGVETLISRIPSILVGMRLDGINCGSC